MNTFGAFVRRLRDDRDLSLRELAKRLEVSAPYVSDIELGRRFPSDDVLVRMAEHLGVAPEELRAQDTRAPIDEIRRITQDDPQFAVAFRTVIESKITGQELLDLLSRQAPTKAVKAKR